MLNGKKILGRVLAIVVTFNLIGCVSMQTKPNQTQSGTVIILNGPSAAGKSSVQKAFQKLNMPKLWIKIGIDNLFDFPMPDITQENLQYWQAKNPIRWVSSTTDSEGKKSIELHVGSQGQKVALAMNSAIAAYAREGLNVVVDYIAYKEEWLSDLETKLKPFMAVFVAVDISIEELERREAARKTSPVGHTRSHYNQVYWNKAYDLRVSTEKNTADEIAQQISNFLKSKM